MSHRGRTLIANNLVSSTLWHRLACVDPPPSLLAEVQRVLVDFFWGKMHWIPQSVLFLPKEEGGAGPGPSGQQGRCLPPPVHPEVADRAKGHSVETSIPVHPATF